jgi:hypothetical protein
VSNESSVIEPTSVQTGAEVAAQNDAPMPATQDPAPAKMNWGSAISGILNFITLGLRVMALAIAATLLKEQLHLLKRRMKRDAVRARRLSEQLAQAGAGPRHQARALEVARAFERVAEASGEVARAADQMEANAVAVRDAHDSEYGGIHETVQALPAGDVQPRPGFNEVR